MKRALLIFCLLMPVIGRSEVIDKIVAVANRHIITLSDVSRERQVKLALGQQAPAEDKAIIKALIDRQIIEDQIAQFPGIDVSEDQVEQEMRRIVDLHGARPEDVRAALRQQLRESEFIEQRFRQFLQATDDDVREYYETKFVPEARKRGLNPIPPLDQVSAEIRKNVIEEKLMHDVDNWLEASRRRSDIEIFD